jgi:hypothetical protein
MKIEVKKISHNARLSEETMCFSADLYVDGKNIGSVGNRGHGGCNDFNVYGADNRALMQKAEEFCKGLPPVNSYDMVLPMDLEFFVTLLVSREISRKEFTRLCKTKVVFEKGDEIYTASVPKGKTPDENYCVGYQNHFPEAKVLNFLPLNDALNIYTGNDYAPLTA